MILMIFSTIVAYNNKKNHIKKFIDNSQDCVVVLEKIDAKEKESLLKKLKSLTFQDVVVEEVEGKFYFKIKCPPDRIGFFRKWASNYQGENNE